MQRGQIVLAETEAADGLGAARVGRCIAHDRALAILLKLFLFFANVVRFSKRSLNDIVSMRGTWKPNEINLAAIATSIFVNRKIFRLRSHLS